MLIFVNNKYFYLIYKVLYEEYFLILHYGFYGHTNIRQYVLTRQETGPDAVYMLDSLNNRMGM